MQGSGRLDFEDIQNQGKGGFAIPTEDVRSQLSGLLSPTIFLRECEKDCGTRSNPVPRLLMQKKRYWKRLKEMSLYSLERRHERYAVI